MTICILKLKGLSGAMALFAALGLASTASAAVITTATGVDDTATGLSWLKLDATGGMSFNTLAPQLAPGGAFSGYRLAVQSEIWNLLSNRLSDIAADTLDRRTAFYDFKDAIGATPFRSTFPGDGTNLTIGGVFAQTGPVVSMTPINASFTPTGASFTEGTHRVFNVNGVNLQNTPGYGGVFYWPTESSAAFPDSFTTGYALGIDLIDPATRTNFLLSQGFDTSQAILPSTVAGFWLVQATPAAVPEPASLALFSIGLFALAALRRGRSDPAHNCSI